MMKLLLKKIQEQIETEGVCYVYADGVIYSTSDPIECWDEWANGNWVGSGMPAEWDQTDKYFEDGEIISRGRVAKITGEPVEDLA